MKSLLGKLGVILIGLTIFTYGQVWAADWVWVDRGSTGDVFRDRESISYLEGGLVRVWEKEVLNEKGIDTYVQKYGVNFRNVTEHRSFIEIDCLNKRYRYLSISWYSKDGGLISAVKEPTEWMYIVPESWGYWASKQLCK